MHKLYLTTCSSCNGYSNVPINPTSALYCQRTSRQPAFMMSRFYRFVLIAALPFNALLSHPGACRRTPTGGARAAEPVDEVFHLSDWEEIDLSSVQPASMLQPTPLITPRTVVGGEGNAVAPNNTATMPAPPASRRVTYQSRRTRHFVYRARSSAWHRRIDTCDNRRG